MKTNYFSFFTKFNCVALLLALWFSSNTTNAQITTTIYPTNSSMNTGYVTSGGVKYSGDMQVSTTTYGRGWAKFPLTSIPTGSTLTAATIEFYTYGGVASTGANTIRGFTGDPVSMTGTTLYNTIGSGTSYNSSTWTIGTTTTPSLNSRSLAGGAPFVQGQIGTGYVNFGFVRGSSNLHSIYGFSNTTYRVRLIVTYTLPACSGTPAAGTANVNGNTSIQVCDNSSFSLNCSGQATSTGITANWQIGTSAGGPFSDISGASAATFSASTTATRYYRYRVTCSNSGLSSYSNVLTVTFSTISNPTASNQTITCNQTATLTASGAPSGGSYTWYSNSTGTTQVGTGATFTTPVLTTTTTYYVRSILGLCNSALVPVTVTVSTASTPIVSNTTINCGQTATLTASSNSNLTWYSNSTGTTQVGIGTSFTTPILTTTTTYYVQAGSGACASALVPVTVTVNTTVASPTASGQTISCNQTATLTASGAPSGGSYTWYSNSTGTTQVGAGSSFTTPALTSSTTYYVAANSTSSTFNFTSPTVNSTSNPGTTTTYTVPSTPQPTGNATITVSARGDFDIPTSQEFLDIYGENSTYLGQISGSTNCNWYTGTYTVPLATLTNWVSNGNITLTFTPGTGVNTNQCNTNAYEVYFTISYTTGSGCSSALIPVTVTVSAASSPVVSNTTINCNQTATLTASSNSTLTWYSDATGTTQVGTGTSYTTPALTSTTIYYVKAGSGGCASSLVPVTATVNSASTPSITNATVICNQTATLTASSNSTLTWYSDATGTTQVGTGTSYTTPALTSTTIYYVKAGSGGCASSLVPVTATVNLAAGPTVTGTTLICGSGSTTLTATGSGNPVQWYSDAGATNLLGTGTTYTTPNLSANTTYHVREGAAASVQTFTYTSPVTATYTTGGAVSITVPSTPTGASGNGTLTVYLIGDLDGTTETVSISSETGSIATGVYTGTQCSATYWSNTYSLTAANINSWASNGTINFNFQSSAGVNNICTAGAAFQVYVTLTYNYNTGLSPCNSSLTPVTVTINPTSVAGTASSDQTICSGATAALTLTGQTGTIQWQQSANGTSGWSNVTTGTGATTTNYTSAALSATTYYRALVTSGVCSSVNSNVITVTVSPTSVAGTAGSDQTICSGATAALTLTGQTGTIQWQQSANGTSGWSNVTTGTGATTTNYTSAALSATTYYRALVTSGVCSSVNSNVVTITVNPASVVGTAGLFDQPLLPSQIICSGATVSLTLTGSNATTIQWQQSANGTSGWSDVTTGTGATTSNYTSASLSATTYYRAYVTFGICGYGYSGLITVTVSPTSVAGTAGSDQTICSGATAALTLTGQIGTIQWKQSANGTSGWSNVITGAGGTTTNYTSAALSATTYYRAVVSSGVCSSVNSNVVTVTVNQPSVNPSSITGSLSICLGASTTLTAVGGTLGVGANYQWGTGLVIGSNPISGATSSTLSASPSSSTNYWVQIVNGTGPCSITTAGLSTTITVNTPTLASNPTAGSAVWRGASSTDWTTASNWYAYDGTDYSVATNLPGTSSNVIIPANQGCVTQQPSVGISGTVNANNLTVETGATLTMGTSSVLNVAGNFTINGTGTFNPSTGTVNFTGGNGVAQFVTNGTQAFNNVTVSGFGTVQMTGNTTINGNFLNTDGTLDMNNFNLTVGGNYANYNSSSGLLPGTGTIIFNKASGTQTVEQYPLDFGNIQHSGAGTLQLISNLSTTGDIINSAGTIDGNDKIITVRNNFTNTANFTPGTQGIGEIYFENVGGSQTLTPGTSVFHKFAHTGTGTLNLSGIVEVKGDVVIDAPISAGTSTLKLSGTGNQIMSGTQSVIALKDMTVAKTAGTVTLSKPVRVDGALTMTQGNIITSATSTLEIGSSTSALGSVNWASGNVVGPMRRWFAGATNSTAASGMFPVGLSTVNRYAQVNFTQAPGSGGYIDMEYKAGQPANAANWTYLTTPDGQLIQTFEDEGYWDITPYDAAGNAYPSGLNTSAFTMKLRANGLTAVNDITITRIIRSPGPLHTTWEPAGFHLATTGTSSDFAIESNTITGFSWFNIGSPNNNALPVELLNFNGTCNEGMVNLVWQTASEFNSSHFDVEKSTDGETWRVLTIVPSAGTSNELLTYQAMDNSGTNGSNYYRLRQVDNDGKEKLYDPINVSCVETTAGYFTSYPNPSGNEFQVVINNKEILGACTLNIVDAQGKVIDQRSIEVKDGINMFVITETLNPGIYFLNITSGTKTTHVIKHAVK